MFRITVYHEEEPVRYPAFANLLIDYMRVLVTTCCNPGPVE